MFIKDITKCVATPTHKINIFLPTIVFYSAGIVLNIKMGITEGPR